MTVPPVWTRWEFDGWLKGPSSAVALHRWASIRRSLRQLRLWWTARVEMLKRLVSLVMSIRFCILRTVATLLSSSVIRVPSCPTHLASWG